MLSLVLSYFYYIKLQVVKAKSIDDDNFYAIKFSKEAFDSLKNREDKLNEFKKQCMIPHHRNLANIYCAWEEKGRIFVQMKLGSNGCLARLVSEHKKCLTLLPEKQVWKYFIDILLVNFLILFIFNFLIFKGCRIFAQESFYPLRY